MKVTQTVSRYDDGTVDYTYDYRGYTVVVGEEDGFWYATLFTGTYENPVDREVPGRYSSKPEVKAAVEEMVDREIYNEISWEKRTGLYEYDPRDDYPEEI